MENSQRETLIHLVALMRKDAEQVGSMHAWWEDIAEAECYLFGNGQADADKEKELLAKFGRGLGLFH